MPPGMIYTAVVCMNSTRGSWYDIIVEQYHSRHDKKTNESANTKHALFSTGKTQDPDRNISIGGGGGAIEEEYIQRYNILVIHGKSVATQHSSVSQ